MNCHASRFFSGGVSAASSNTVSLAVSQLLQSLSMLVDHVVR